MLPKYLLPVALSVANVTAHPVDAPTKTVWASSTTSTLPTEGIEYILPKDDQATTVAPTPETTAAAAVLSASSPENSQQRPEDGGESRTRDPKEWFKHLTEALGKFNGTRAVKKDLLERRCREDPVGFMEEIEFKYSKFRQQCRFTSLVPDDQRTERLNHRH